VTKLYEANTHIIIDTNTIKPIEHSHMASHVIISMGGKMKVMSDEEEHVCQGIMIPSGVPHVVDTYGERVLVFLYDNTTNVATHIRVLQTLSDEICNVIVESYIEFCNDSASQSYKRLEDCILQQLDIDEARDCVTDERIISAIKYMHSMSSEQISCKEVADFVHLSESRFSHLFKNQVGMTFASYLIYQRIMYVYTQIIRGKSITDAAIEAGFSSSAHFADVNRRVFGVTASNMTQDLIFIKVS